MFHQFTRITRFTSQTIQNASENTAALFSIEDTTSTFHQQTLVWLSDTQIGMDSFFDDQINDSQALFQKHNTESPFHALGSAFLAYVEAMLTFEPDRIQIALDKIVSTEDLIKQVTKKLNKRKKDSFQEVKKSPVHTNEHLHDIAVSISFSSPTMTPSSSTGNLLHTSEVDAAHRKKNNPCIIDSDQAIVIQYKLLELNCMLMYATLQFLNENWTKYIRIAYKLRKAYKTYEYYFQWITGYKPSDYAKLLEKTDKCSLNPMCLYHTFPNRHCDVCNVFTLPDSKESLSPKTTNSQDTVSHNPSNSPKRSSTLPYLSSVESAQTEDSRMHHSGLSLYSFRDAESGSKAKHGVIKDPLVSPSSYRRGQQHKTCLHEQQEKQSTLTEGMIKSGIFFGVGIFSLVFSLLPPKANKVLNTLGFHSSRLFSIHLLQKSYQTKGFYATLAGMALLSYYTSLSFFGHPRLLPKSIQLEDARTMLDQMKQKYPQGKIWQLLEGRLVRIEGSMNKSIDILRHVQRRDRTWYTAMAVDSTKSKLDKRYGLDSFMCTKSVEIHHGSTISDFVQFQVLAIHEMGWGKIFMKHYLQASETFFRLETMHTGSNLFYHYIASCCMLANQMYDKAALEFNQMKDCINRRRHAGTCLLEKEQFIERRIQVWMTRVYHENKKNPLDGCTMSSAVLLDPLWELVYLWNGIPFLEKSGITELYHDTKKCMAHHQNLLVPSEMALLCLIHGVVNRELGHYYPAEEYLQKSMMLETQLIEDHWIIRFACYELATAYCLRMQEEDTEEVERQRLIQSVHDLFRRSMTVKGKDVRQDTSKHQGIEWESRLHIRWQLLFEGVDLTSP
ncbi:hypothetical protein BDF14DRAFT_1881020 [Spinellus fusiger]|nr:hypothetical protein BDF14DRAFT_1881020 [Spinellus fusiger]